jgi:hypothetical protein
MSACFAGELRSGAAEHDVEVCFRGHVKRLCLNRSCGYHQAFVILCVEGMLIC